VKTDQSRAAAAAANMPEKQLELSKRNAFFKDPFFQDLVGGCGDGLERRLAEFSARSMGVAGAGLNEAAHNIQVSASNDKFMVQLELPGFAPEDFSLKTKDDIIIVEAVHNAKTEDGSTDSRKFTKEFKMPGGVVTDQLSSTYSGTGILTVSAPRVISAPDGAQVSEAMKAQSQAYVTDDGVAVKKDDKASSQSMAATTQSEDGSTISSFKSSSSSSSSSTMMSSGGPMPGGMLSMGGMGGMGGGMGGGMPSLGMDDMMSKMMSKMGSMDMSSGMSNMGSSNMSSSSMSSSSFSSSSSSSMSSNMSSNMLGGMPPMRGMQMPGFDMPGLSFQEMPSMPATPSMGGDPGYTVTSPPMSPPPPELSHKVQKTEDYVPPTTQTAEATVLLKVKEGDEYKLALNMQQYSPEDITIKLNGNELAIEASAHGEQFKQKHIIPDNIDLDAMSSSFSSDGVLVIKAPKK
jgi:HSP20 family molecular chaperone IbpA